MVLNHRVTEGRIEEVDGAVHNMIFVFLSFEDFVLVAQIELGWSRI